MSLRAVLLDVDGTLVDSNDAHARAWVDALSEFGRAVPLEKIRGLVGMGGDNLLPAATGLSAEEGEGKRIADRRGEIFESRYLPHVRAFPGTRDLLDRLRATGLKLVVASSSEEETLKALLSAAGADDLVPAATSADDAESSKPDPDIVQAALRRAGVRPEEAILVGDTPYDVEAAGRAGVRVIAFRCGGFPEESLKGAIAIYDGPGDLAARFESSPLAVRRG